MVDDNADKSYLQYYQIKDQRYTVIRNLNMNV